MSARVSHGTVHLSCAPPPFQARMAEARERASEQRGAAWRTAAENLEQVKVAAQVRRAVHEPHVCRTLPYSTAVGW